MEFPGTLLIVSHDFYFINKLCDTILLFQDGKIQRFDMSLKEYEEKKKSMGNNSLQKEEEMLIDLKISAAIGKLSQLTKGNKDYEQLEKEYNDLLSRKKALEIE
ncbi:hypothetical protein [Metabacillus lacus]|uniref:hypothetical protein n=1 Tax=Metabacillus lacus TaxID=1983721 RepID=UPI001FE31029|nr:hypothetical protein [Metabacillus lacus]